MAITKDKKRDIVAKIESAVKGAVSVAFVRFNRLTVADASKLRKELKSNGVGYYVAKKTLIKLVMNTKGYGGAMPDLPGEIAIAWSTDDATAPAREVYDFGKKLKGALALVGGVFENAYLDAARITAIATIPPLPILRGMFVNVINAPRHTFVVALSEIAKKKAP